jgi:hypothetical protein
MSLLMGILLGRMGGDLIALTDGQATDSDTTPTNASASISMKNDGDIDFIGIGSDLNRTDEWDINSDLTASDYEVMYSPTGDAPGGSLTATWLNLGTTRTWTLSTSGIGTLTCTGLMEIGLAGTSTTLVSATFTITAIEGV